MDISALLTTLILFNSVNIFVVGDTEWNYDEHGPDVWKDSYPSCKLNSQSPIDIHTECTTYQSYKPFQFSIGYYTNQNFRVVNNGHTIGGVQMNAGAYPLVLSGGGLNETFKFANFHIHWGENYEIGSEHQLNGKKYSAEAHFVHTNEAGTINAVLGIFIQTSASTESSTTGSSGHRKKIYKIKRDTANTGSDTINEWTSYFSNGATLNKINDSIVLNFILSSLMGTDLTKFYRYSGSLTTPPCTQNVIWTVFETPIEFSQSVLDGLRNHVMERDYRLPQPLNGRTVYRSFQPVTRTTASDYHYCVSTTAAKSTANMASIQNSFLLITIIFIFLPFFTYSFIF